MNGKIARSIAAATLGALLVLASAGSASAGIVSGKGTSGAQAAGTELVELRDQLSRSVEAEDVKSTKDTLEQLDPLLTDLSTGKVYTIEAEVQETAATAQEQRTEIAQALSDSSAKARQDPQEAVKELRKKLQNLVDAIDQLVKHLLTSLPSA